MTLSHTDDEILALAKEIERKRADEYHARAKKVSDRVESGAEPFTDAELIYASACRCKCGAGMAYPKGIGGSGMWVCSALLKSGERSPEAQDPHTPAMPFMFYEIKSELQPSACSTSAPSRGRTTRQQP